MYPQHQRPSPFPVAPILLALLIALALGLGVPSTVLAQGGLADGVGIRVSVADERPESLEADLDLTMYTRVGPYPSTYAGLPTYGFPAIDYGDGSTLASTTLLLATTGAGPGGSNVYRNAASFTHTYPSTGAYTVTAASLCTGCLRAEYTFLYVGGSPTSLGPTSFDYVPTTVVGNLADPTVYSGTILTPFGSYSVRYLVTYYPAVTNTTEVVLASILEIPTASTWGLAAFGVLLLATGWLVLRRL